MKKNKPTVSPISFKPKPIVVAVQHALPYLVALGLGAAVVSPAVGRSGDSAAAFTATQLIRQFTLKNTVAQVSQGMQGYVAEFNGVLRASEMGALVGGYPVDMGSVPSSVNLPQRDGAGRPLGYCAWDNSASTSNSSFLAGQGVVNPLVYAVVSPGLNGSMETSCTYILANRRGLGDDYVQVTAPSQTSSKQFKSAVGTYAELTAMPGEEGDIRLVLESNKLYSYVGGAWQPVDASKFNDDSAANGAGAIAYTTGKVTVADFQAASATITGALSGSAATFTSSVTANSFIGNGAALTDLNASNVSSGVLGAAFGGTGVDSSAAAQGSLLIGTGAGFALGAISAGDGIGVLNGAGSITISNTGVLSIAGTNNQVIASAMNGDVVLSLPQDIATTSTPTFAGAMFNGNIDVASISQAGVPATLAFQYASDTGSTFYAEPNLGLGTGALAGRKSAGNVAIGMNVLGRMSTLGYGSESGSWNTGVGYQALFSNDYGDENTAVGYKSLYSNTTGFYNTAMGSQSMLSNSTGRSNTAIGYDAMRMNTTGSSNASLGVSALHENTTGYRNVAVGVAALYDNTTGYENVAVGRSALYSNNTGWGNVAIGLQSMLLTSAGTENTAIGHNALRPLISGTENTVLGAWALDAFSSGSGNVAIGANTGNKGTGSDYLLTSGSNNTFVGNASGPALGVSSLDYATAIGAEAEVSTSNTLALGRVTDSIVIGATGIASSGVLLGKKLQVTGDVGISGALTIGGTFTTTGFSGNGSGLTDLNASNINSGTLDAAYGGTGVVGSSAANGTLLIGNGAGYTLSTLTAGPGIGIANGVGNITIANTGVTTFNGRTGAIVLTRADISSAASSGIANVAVGEHSLGSLTTGVYNTAFGTWALKSVSTGDSNTAVGTGSQEFATGSSNTSLGRETLRSASGSNNTAVGHVALGSLTTGDSNSAVGIAAGSGLTTGSNNTLLGTGANVASGALNYATALGSHATVGTPNTIVLGRATDVTVIGAAVDDGSGNKLQVTGGIKSTGTITGSTGAFTSLNVSGSVDASGTVASTTTVRDLRVMSSFDDTVWDHIRIHNQDGVNAFFDAGGAESGLFFRVSNAGVGGPGTHSYNTVLALHSSRLAEFFGNVNVGGTVAASRLLFTNTASNIAIGGNTLSDLESGYDNIAIGNYVMSGNISGSNNIAIGAGAQNCNETGIRNVAVGYETLNCLVSGDLNTAVGSSALYSTDGFGNTGIGAVALVSNSTGNENTGLGYNAGRQRGNNFAANQRYGSNNTFLGAYSHPVTDTLFYATAIGSDAGVSTNNTVVLGRVADVTVIGSTGDDGSGNKLQVTGGALITGVASLKGGASIATGTNFRFGVAGENSDDIYFLRSDPAANQSSLMLNLGDDPGTFGDVAADEFQISTSGIARFRVAGSGDVIANGYVQATAFNVSSDRRLKTNIQAQDSGAVLSRLEQLQTYSYKYLANPNLGRRIGVIAQEIQSLFPEAVATRADGMMSVDYSALGAMAAMGVGHLSKQVKVLDKTLAEQGERITVLDDRINQHDTRITSLESWRADTSKRMDGMQTAIDLNIQKIAENAVAIQTNSVAIERLDDALFTLDGQVKNNSDLINNINSRWAKNFSESADGSLLTVNAVELKVSNFTAQQLRANSVYSQRLEAEMARIADLEVNNLKANSAVANTVRAEQVNTGSAQVYAGVGLPAVLFAAKSDGHYTVSTSALDGSYATATVIVNAGQAKVVSVASEGIELYAEGNQVKVIAAGKSIKASWIKMG